LWLFLAYSFLGVLVEGIFGLLVDGVLELRLGLLYLPLRPIYGIGGAGCALLTRFIQRPVLVFVLGALICSVVEYAASLATEKAFGTVSWDYSDKALNVQGRVCLQYSLGWGVLALLVVYALDPLVYGFVNLSGRRPGELLLTVLMVLVSLSALITVAALVRLRTRVAALRAQAAGQVTTTADTTWHRLIGRLVPDAVMMTSFPRMNLLTQLGELTGVQRDPVVRSPRVDRPEWPRRAEAR